MRVCAFIPAVLTACQLVSAGGTGAEPAKKSFQALASEAQAAQADHKNDAAIELYRKALALKADWSEGWWHLGTLLYSEQQFGAAREAFNMLFR